MRNLPFPTTRIALMAGVCFGSATVAPNVKADPAQDLAARLSAVQTGNSFVRLTLKVEGGGKDVRMQIQIKERRAARSADVLYQVLYPREQKSEAVLLKQSGGGTPTGHVFRMPDRLSQIGGGDLDGGIFGSDLAYRDVIENFFGWGQQRIVGHEVIDRKDCQILESKPGNGENSSYGSVKSWIDTERNVPLRVEKYDARGRLVRRIDTTRVHKNGNDDHIPATLVVRRAGGATVTELEGSRSKVDVRYTDDDFTVAKMRDLSSPR